MAYNFRSSSMFSLFIMLARIRTIRYVTFKRPFPTTCVSKWSRAIHDLSNQFCSLMVSFRLVFKIAFEKWFFVLVLAQEHECQFGLVEYSFERSHNACFETVATSQSLSTQLFDHKEGSALHPAESCQNTLWKWIRLCKLIERIYFYIYFQIPESYCTPLSAEKRERLKKSLQPSKKSTLYIVKPSNSSRGRGIQFLNAPEQVIHFATICVYLSLGWWDQRLWWSHHFTLHTQSLLDSKQKMGSTNLCGGYFVLSSDCLPVHRRSNKICSWRLWWWCGSFTRSTSYQLQLAQNKWQVCKVNPPFERTFFNLWF